MDRVLALIKCLHFLLINPYFFCYCNLVFICLFVCFMALKLPSNDLIYNGSLAPGSQVKFFSKSHLSFLS